MIKAEGGSWEVSSDHMLPMAPAALPGNMRTLCVQLTGWWCVISMWACPVAFTLQAPQWLVAPQQTHSLQDVAKRIKQDFIPTFAAECTYWPLIQGTNFYRVPVQHQLLVSSVLLASSTMLRYVSITPARFWVSP